MCVWKLREKIIFIKLASKKLKEKRKDVKTDISAVAWRNVACHIYFHYRDVKHLKFLSIEFWFNRIIFFFFSPCKFHFQCFKNQLTQIFLKLWHSATDLSFSNNFDNYLFMYVNFGIVEMGKMTYFVIFFFFTNFIDVKQRSLEIFL